MGRVKRFFAGEYAKLKAMNGPERRWYLWEYYKLHLLALVVFVSLAGSLIDAWFIHKPKNVYLHVGWLAEFQVDEALDTLARAFTDAIVTDAAREEVLVTTFVTVGESTEFHYALQQRFAVMMAAGELHAFIVGDAAYVQGLAAAGVLRPLDGVMAELAALDPALADALSARLLYVTPDPATDAVRGYYGVPIADSPLLKGLAIPAEGAYLCVSVVAEYDLATAEALRALYYE